MYQQLVEKVKNKRPLIHCITNKVTINDCANVVLAVNGSPIMADDENEVEDITTICDGLVLNIGTLSKSVIPSMIKAANKAKELHHPVVLDPVGIGASKLRKEVVFQLLESSALTLVKGNLSEMKVIESKSGTTKGVDVNIEDTINDDNIDQYVAYAKNLSKKINAIVVITGPIDIVSDDKKSYIIRNGCKEMSKITGTGCMLTTVIATYVTANLNQPLEAAALATAMMGYSGELAYQKICKENSGLGSMHMYLIDYLSKMDQLYKEGIKIESR